VSKFIKISCSHYSILSDPLRPLASKPMMFMVAAAVFLLAFHAFLVAPVSSATSYIATCQQIAGAISSASIVSYSSFIDLLDGSSYWHDNSHFMISSAQPSACSVQPGTAADVGTIVRFFLKPSFQVLTYMIFFVSASNPQFYSHSICSQYTMGVLNNVVSLCINIGRRRGS
jgi:hypothetical protein